MTEVWARFTAVLVICVATLAFALALAQDLPVHIDGLVREDPSVLDLVVERMDADADAIGLTRTRIERRVRLRLREAGIEVGYHPDGAYLYVNVNVGSSSASSSLNLARWVEYDVDGRVHRVFGNTWDQSMLSSFGRPSSAAGDHVLSGIEQLLDIFLLDYFEANPDF